VQILKYVSNLIWQIVKELIPLGSSLDRYGRKDGCWAVVTGGTDGIGLGFCEVLSEMGWNVCIISRN
jgi:17beta-estradiol 17-dehydrogenase / very-long-chain 3-oxoacyl-CoA reductase